LVQWVVALNCFGYFGIRSRDANIRYIFWQSEELFRQKVELEQAYHAEKAAYDRFLQFAELISHEFRNCLAVVKGKAQLMRLANELGAPPDLNASLAIERAADRMDYLFSQWLASDSFVESGFALRVQRVSLKAFLERVVSETHISRSHPISLSPVSNIDLDIDTDLFVLALGNIIGNAVKYSPDGGKIEITAKSSEDRIEIVIADHGIGIAAADRELIFNKYYRVRYDNGVNGLGLGLFFVRRVVKLHGGTVRAEPNPGGGSIFIISLPYIGDTNHANVGICR
jgi:signal transduction histidine kinase